MRAHLCVLRAKRSHDAVTVADFLESVRFANQLQRSPSMWLLSDAAQELFDSCARRLRRVVRVESPDLVPEGCVHTPDVKGAFALVVVTVDLL